MELLEQGRLGGVLVDALRRRSVSVTPGVKNSVEAIVSDLSRKHEPAPMLLDRSQVLSSEATATIMFTDIVSSSSLMGRLGDGLARELMRGHNEIVRSQTQAHGGVEVKSTGDGFMLTFPSARRGVACAAAIQKELAEYNLDHPDSPFAVRVGISVGEPIREEQDLFGTSVVLAARISGMAEGGQVLMSQIVHALVGGLGEFALRELGAFELKGLSGIHPVYELLWREL